MAQLRLEAGHTTGRGSPCTRVCHTHAHTCTQESILTLHGTHGFSSLKHDKLEMLCINKEILTRHGEDTWHKLVSDSMKNCNLLEMLHLEQAFDHLTVRGWKAMVGYLLHPSAKGAIQWDAVEKAVKSPNVFQCIKDKIIENWGVLYPGDERLKRLEGVEKVDDKALCEKLGVEFKGVDSVFV